MKKGYLDLDPDELLKLLEKKDKEIDDLNTKLIDLTFELNYNKQVELIEFIRELYSSCKSELNPVEDRFHKTEEKSSKEILTNLVKYIANFAKDNNIRL